MDKSEARKKLWEYVARNRKACPFCGTQKMFTNCLSFDAESGELRRCRECRVCGKVWREIFELSGIDLFGVGGNVAPVYLDDKEVTE